MQALTFFFAFVAVLALIGVAAWLVRRFATNRLGANTNRGRMPRLAVIDAAAVDGRRRLVLVRRDNIEHLIMIGGPSDIVVETNIVRAMPARDQVAQRGPGAAEPQPPRIAPLPDAAWEGEPARVRELRTRRTCHARAAAAAAAPLLCRRSPPAATASARAAQRSARRFLARADGRARRAASRNLATAYAARRRASRRTADDAAPVASGRTAEGAAAPPGACDGSAAASRRRRLLRHRRLFPRPTRTSPRWRSGSRPHCAVLRATMSPRPCSRKLRLPHLRRPPGPRAARRLRPRRRRPALRISKTRWRRCSVVQRTLREGRSPSA